MIPDNIQSKTATAEAGEFPEWCELPLQGVRGVRKIRYCEDFQKEVASVGLVGVLGSPS